MNKKQTIRLNENQLKNIIKESVRQVLNEADTYDKSLKRDGAYFNYGNGAMRVDPKNRFVSDYGNRDKSKEEIDKHNLRVMNRRSNVDPLELRKNAVENCVKELMKYYPNKGEDFERLLKSKLYHTLNTIQSDLADIRAIRAANMDKTPEGGEGFQYLSNPSSLPAGWQ